MKLGKTGLDWTRLDGTVRAGCRVNCNAMIEGPNRVSEISRQYDAVGQRLGVPFLLHLTLGVVVIVVQL